MTIEPVTLRRQAVAAQAERMHGATLAACNPAVGIWVLAAVLASALLAGFVVWGQYTRKEHVVGYLAPTRGLIKVFTPLGGTVLERRVVEGQSVKQGDVLLVISSERSSTLQRDAQATVLGQLGERRASLLREQSKQSEIDALAAASISKRMAGLSGEIEQLRAQQDIQRRRVASAERAIDRYQALVAEKFFAESALQQKQDELLDQRNLLANLNRSFEALARELNSAKSELAATDLKRGNNASLLGRQISELEQQTTEADSRRTVVLTAAVDGTVTTILAETGQLANPGVLLMSILPADASLEAELLVPTRAAGFIRSGQPVALRYQAFPYQRFGHYQGRILRVGRSVIQPNESPLPVALQEPVYRVTVELPSQQVRAYGRAVDLQSGMAVDADIWIDRRSILEWLVDPLLSVTGRV